MLLDVLFERWSMYCPHFHFIACIWNNYAGLWLCTLRLYAGKYKITFCKHTFYCEPCDKCVCVCVNSRTALSVTSLCIPRYSWNEWIHTLAPFSLTRSEPTLVFPQQRRRFVVPAFCRSSHFVLTLVSWFMVFVVQASFHVMVPGSSFLHGCC